MTTQPGSVGDARDRLRRVPVMVERDLIDDAPGPWTALGLYVGGVVAGVVVIGAAVAFTSSGGRLRTQVLTGAVIFLAATATVTLLRWRWFRALAAGLATVAAVSGAVIVLLLTAFWNLTF
jgi:hypothetical protein